ncbi:dihydroneopterin aldolase [Reinekea sp.]|jgi:dihydroneopterin aldolase|uniref:dihydroneopterin aldolase n=1 Tax=Reinekea sp. TaxID=1970455 RepID=UPI002A815F7F|nr:dihydroneopterin aldolase [Reinekea sp.]
MSDSVYVTGLRLETLIGVYAFERTQRQLLFIDLELDFDCKAAGQSDDLRDALDYDRLFKTLRRWALEQNFQLLESFAEALCQLVHEQFAIGRMQLQINKPAAVSECTAVGIRIERCFR